LRDRVGVSERIVKRIVNKANELGGRIMGDPFVGEIRLFAGNFAPLNWHFCDGTLMPIDQNNALYALLGTTYGGNGTTTFALPNLLSRLPVHQGTLTGQTFVIGEIAGVENVTLTTQQMPSHTHVMFASTGGQVQTPSGAVIPAQATTGAAGSANVYSPPPPVTGENIHPGTLTNDGKSQPHTNLQPFIAMNYIISLFGTFPSQG
jgi:microcystin-dependent protein